MKTWVVGLLIGVNRFAILVLGFAITAKGFAIYNVGDKPADECWLTLAPVTAKYCLSDVQKNADVAVIVRNAGWCPPCNREFKDLVPLTAKFAGKKVEFISVSAEGWSHGSVPDNAFMQSWDTKFGLRASKATWVVASDYRNFGKNYYRNPSIPNVQIIDSSGKLVFKGMGTSPREVVRQVESLKPGLR